MEVILKQDVEKIGRAGAVVKVKDGFARNFLIPRNFAVPLTSENLKKLENEKQKRQLQLEKEKKEAQLLKDKLAALSLTIPVLTQEDEQLYGSITNQEISNALKEEGIEVAKNLIVLTEPIKALGIYEIPVKLHSEVTATLKVWIVKK